jgi:hypothetical protein
MWMDAVNHSVAAKAALACWPWRVLRTSPNPSIAISSYSLKATPTISPPRTATAFLCRITVTVGENHRRIEGIYVMSFDDDGNITSMKADWGPQNIGPL